MSKKSLIAKISEYILKNTKPSYMDSKDKIDEFIIKEKKTKKEFKPLFKIKKFYIDQMKVFEFGDKNRKNTILYIHGGAFINEINYQHILYCYLLSKKLDAYVLAPVYPLTPLHKAEESYELILKLYEKIETDNLILMGDSAGGGFVHSFCQYLNTTKFKQPKKIISFSPWVDISMSNTPYNSEDDPILGEIGLKEIGKSWAGELNTLDYKVSPLYGDNKNLPDTLIFAGENEIFYKDIEKYVENLRNDGVNVRFITGPGLYHIYPLFPIPEARKAFKEVKNEINR